MSLEQLLNIVTSELTDIARKQAEDVFDEHFPGLSKKTVDVKDKSEIITAIYAKPLWSVAEAALVLPCSENHLRNLIEKALKGDEDNPIPFIDIAGVYGFERDKLLEWLKIPKQDKRKNKKLSMKPAQSGRAKSHLKVINRNENLATDGQE